MNAFLKTAALAAALASSPAAFGELLPGNETAVIGGPSPLLIAGAEAMKRGEYRQGVDLTLAGLEDPNAPRDIAAALTNLCAGYVSLKEFALALRACDRALVIDRNNWRTWNNRAAAHLGQGRHDAAIADVQTGLGIAPRSATLRRTLAIIESRKRAAEGQDEKVIKA